MSDTEWLRLPEEGKRCTVTGLSPSSLTELLNERDPETGELLIRSIIKKKDRGQSWHSPHQQTLLAELS